MLTTKSRITHTEILVKNIAEQEKVAEMDENLRETVGNKQILFKGYIEGAPKESDMELKLGNEIKLEAPKGSGAFLVKNLYLSCDPYMRGRMRDFHGSYIPPFVPGSVRLSTPLKVLILSHDVCEILVLCVFVEVYIELSM